MDVLQSPRLADGDLRRLDQHPAEGARTLFGDVAHPGLAARNAHTGREAGEGHQVLGIWKAAHVADLGQDGERGESGDTRDGREQAGRWLVGSLTSDGQLYLANLGTQAVQDPQIALE